MSRNKLCTLSIHYDLTVEDLAAIISDTVQIDDAAKFIALLDQHYQDWSLTEILIKHFKHLEVIYKKEIPSGEQEELTPKSVL